MGKRSKGKNGKARQKAKQPEEVQTKSYGAIEALLPDDRAKEPSGYNYRGKNKAKRRKQELRRLHAERDRKMPLWQPSDEIDEMARSIRSNLVEDGNPGYPRRIGNPYSGWEYGLRGVYTPLNKAGLRRFQSCNIGNIQELWHGTSSAAGILENGFDPQFSRTSCMFGQGIYLAPAFEKASGFGHRWRTSGHESNSYIVMLRVRARLGRVWEVGRSMNGSVDTMRTRLQMHGADSVAGIAGQTKTWGSSTLNHDEYVVYNAAQVLVKHVVIYQRRERNVQL